MVRRERRAQRRRVGGPLERRAAPAAAAARALAREARRERGEAGEQVEGELGLLEAREDVLLDRLVHDAADLRKRERL